ncbi:MAG: radical SAM protein [bacterium]|nr:radical SAM protein [bacterium]
MPPYSATLELGRRCNLECRHCFSCSGPDRKPGPTTEEVKKRIQALSALGVRRIWFSGGEPTLRRDLPELITYGAESDLEVYVSSNGLVSREQARQLAGTPLHRIDVAFDGIGDDHDRLRGAGAFRRAITGLGHLKAAGLRIELSVHLRRGMRMSFSEMAERFRELETPLRLAPVLPFGRGRDLASLCPSWEEFLTWTSAFEGCGFARLPSPGAIFCWAGTSTIAIRSSGAIAPCCYQREMRVEPDPEGVSGDLPRLWDGAPLLEAIRAHPPNACDQCNVASWIKRPILEETATCQSPSS